jgi:hemoglobin
MLLVAVLLLLQSGTVPAGEDAVDPYPQSNANAGATPVTWERLWTAFHGRDGVSRIVDDLVARNVADPRISDIFRNQDLVRLRRTLTEQFCYILGGGCDYTGRDMRAAHKDMGIQQADMAALVENLQAAMRRERVSFAAQNRLLAKLAPMHRDVVTR